MTHAEMYEIVKDHPDVWGKVLEYVECEPPSPPLWCMKINDELLIDEADMEGDEWKRDAMPLDDRIVEGAAPVSQAGVYYALLGLGVKWLVQRGGASTIYGPVTPSATDGYYAGGKIPSVWGDSELAAVYAAIAEIKRGKDSATN